MEETKPKRGRPFKKPEEIRGSVLYLKLTQAERELVDRAGGENPTVWAREAVIRAAKRAKG